jgi:hypothetical protein
MDPQIGLMALEVIGTIGNHAGHLGVMALNWADRVALLAIGDPNVALDAIAMGQGAADGAPRDPEARAGWIARTPEALALVAFSVSDAHAEARSRLGLDR